MNYQRIYDQIIDRAKKEKRVKVKGGTYYEAHHIIPKCLGGEGKTSQWRTHPNIVLLTGREHFVCHWLLYRIYPENTKLVFAFWAMCNQKSKYQEERYLSSSRTYEEARKAFSETSSIAQKIVNKTEKGVERRDRQKNSLRQFYKTEEGISRRTEMSTLKHMYYDSEKGSEAKSKQSDTLRTFYQTEKGNEVKKGISKTLIEFYKTNEGEEKVRKGAQTRKAYNKTQEGIESMLRRVAKIDYETLALSNMKAIYQYTKEGSLVKEWSSGTEASSVLGVCRGSISSCLTGKLKSAGGFIWKYKDQK